MTGRARARPVPTVLQLWTLEAFRALEEARCVLNAREYEAFLDLVERRVSRELIRVGLNDWRRAA